MPRNKVAIIGAGISGLYLGWKLSEKGNDVTIFEKKPEIGNEVCSGLFSRRIVDFVPQSKSLVENEINSVVIHFPKKDVRVGFSKSFFVMSHYELDKIVAGLAQKSGVKIILNSSVSSVPEGFDKIIGCDGAESSVRKNLNLSSPRLRLGVQGFEDKENRDDFVETWPCESGFIWKIPRGKKTEYGAMSSVRSAGKVFNDFIREKEIEITDMKAKLIPQGLAFPSDEKITLCGDAAGLTKPWSGGGVIWSMIAADMLVDSFPDFSKYQKKAKRFFLPKILLSKTATKLVYFFGFKASWLLPKKAKIDPDFLF